MKPRDRVILSLKEKQELDRPPFNARFHEGFIQIFDEKVGNKEHLQGSQPVSTGFSVGTAEGVITPEDYFRVDFKHFISAQSKKENDYTHLHDDSAKGVINEWGVKIIRDPKTRSEKRVGPLRDIQSAGELDHYPLPDVDEDYRWQELLPSVEAAREKGLATVGFCHGTFFELICDLRDFETYLGDLVTNPTLTEAILEKVAPARTKQIVGLARTGVDILRVGDNFGMQQGLIISPAMWKQYFKPVWKQAVEAVRKERPDIIFLFKSDGNIEEIIPDLLDIGINMICPVQADAMDAFRLKEEYGNELGIWGTISTQKLLPFGTPKQIKEIVWKHMDILNRGGNFVIEPDHTLLHDVPWENALAFFEAIHERTTKD